MHPIDGEATIKPMSQHGFVFAAFFEGPKASVERIARMIGIDPAKRVRRNGRVWRLQIGLPFDRVTLADYERALAVWESL
jgi:hypothetical protein